MTAFEGRSSGSRRAAIGAALAGMGLALVTATSAFAQDPAPAPQDPQAPAPQGEPPPQQAQAGQPNPFMFDSDAGMLTFFIKADKTADFEKVMSKLHQALANSDKPERRQMAEGWKLFRAGEPGPNNTVLYVNFIQPVLKGGDYTVSKILAEVFPQQVQELFVLYRDSFAGLSRAELTLIEDFGAPYTAPPDPAGEAAPPAPTSDPAPPAAPQ